MAYHTTDDIEEVALHLEGCHIDTLLQDAVAERDSREADGLGDTEPGQHLFYPRSPSLDPTVAWSPFSSPLSSVSTTPSQSPAATPAQKDLSPNVPLLSLDDSQPTQNDDFTSLHTKPRTRKQIGKSKRTSKKKLKVTPSMYKIRSSLSKRYCHDKNVALAGFNMKNLKTVARGAWIAKREATRSSLLTLVKLKAEGIRVVPWDGRTPTLLVDETNVVMAALSGRPGTDEDWNVCRQEASRAMEEAAQNIKFNKRGDRRGPFRTIAAGVSYGGGQKRPGRLHHSKHNQAALEKLMSNKSISRIAAFGSSSFAFYAPKLYRDYATKLDRLYAHYGDMGYNWQTSVFPAASFNFGPNALSFEHRDHGNRAAGWCPIFCDGNFDPRVGGHIILRQFGIAIEFPPGSTALIPSACITHGNVPIQPGESRWSFTQYASGGLFRFVEYGFRSWTTLWEKDRAKAERLLADRDSRWVRELKLFSAVDQLAHDREEAGLLATKAEK